MQSDVRNHRIQEILNNLAAETASLRGDFEDRDGDLADKQDQINELGDRIEALETSVAEIREFIRIDE